MSTSPTKTPERKGILSFFQNVTTIDSRKNSPSSVTKAKKEKVINLDSDENEDITKKSGQEPKVLSESDAIAETTAITNIEESGELDEPPIINEVQATRIGKVSTPSMSEESETTNANKTVIPSTSEEADPVKADKIATSSVSEAIDQQNEKQEDSSSVEEDLSIGISATTSDTTTGKESKLTKKELAAQKREQQKKEKELKKQERERQREEERRKKEEKLKEEKRKREELRKQKEEEKLKREAAKLEAKRQRELERRQREEEKQKREEEKKIKAEAKERAQSRIGNFFRKVNDSNNKLSEKSDYEKHFLPFYARGGVEVCKSHILPLPLLEERKSKIDGFFTETLRSSEDIHEWLQARRSTRGYKIKYTAVDVLQKITAKEKTDEELQTLLSLVPQKYIKFYENVRPPFIGTYSKNVMLPKDDPFSKEGTGYNYEYDSDMEWVNEEEEDGDGGGIDNLESGEEDDDDDDDDDEDEASEGEFDGFLDSEENGHNLPNGKRKFVGPLIPTVNLRNNMEDMDTDVKNYFELTAVAYLIEELPFPVDPYKEYSGARLEEADNKRTITDMQGTATEQHTPNQSPDKKKPKSLITEPKDLLKLAF